VGWDDVQMLVVLLVFWDDKSHSKAHRPGCWAAAHRGFSSNPARGNGRATGKRLD